MLIITTDIAERFASASVILCGLAADGNLEKLKELLEFTSVDVNAGGTRNVKSQQCDEIRLLNLPT